MINREGGMAMGFDTPQCVAVVVIASIVALAALRWLTEGSN